MLSLWLRLGTFNPYAAGGLNFVNTKLSKKQQLKNYWNPGTWVLIWHCTQQEFSNEYQHNSA